MADGNYALKDAVKGLMAGLRGVVAGYTFRSYGTEEMGLRDEVL